MKKVQITVIGSSDARSSLNEAYLIGKYIGKNNYVLITGGRGGIMEAVSKGALEEGGIVIGILPGDNISGANSYCNIVIPTGIGYARNVINILSADIVIAVGGKSGTLTELAYAWQYNKPVICCTFAEGWSKLFPQLEIDDRKGSVIYKAESVGRVFKFIEEIMG